MTTTSPTPPTDPVNGQNGPSGEVEKLRQAVLDKLTYAVGKTPRVASKRDWLVATALAVRDRVVDHWMESTTANYAEDRRRVYYLSLQFLIGRLLVDWLTNLRIKDEMRVALSSLGVRL